MRTTKAYFKKSALFSAVVLFIFLMPIPSVLSQDTLPAQGSDAEDVQESQSPSVPVNVVSNENIEKKTNQFGEQLKEYKEEEITRLRLTNQMFSVAFVVSGITLTFISTALGAVESQNKEVQKWTRIAISTLGGFAVFFQALNSAFPVTERAGEYALIKSKITVLEFKLSDVTNESQLQDIKNEFYELVERTGAAEAEGN